MADDLGDLKATIEALIFASPEPISLKTMVKLLDDEPPEHVEEALTQLRTDWERGGLPNAEWEALLALAPGYQGFAEPDLTRRFERVIPSEHPLAAQAALEGPQDCIATMRAAFKERHDYVVSRLNGMTGIECLPTDGTFYVFPKVQGLIDKLSTVNNDLELADFLIERAGASLKKSLPS